MSAKRVPSARRPISRHRVVMWLGVFTLVLSLLGPLATIQAAAAQETLTQRLQGQPPDCDDNFVPNADATACVPIDGIGETDQQQEEEQSQQDQPPDNQQDQQGDQQQDQSQDEQSQPQDLEDQQDDQQQDEQQSQENQQQDQQPDQQEDDQQDQQRQEQQRPGGEDDEQDIQLSPSFDPSGDQDQQPPPDDQEQPAQDLVAAIQIHNYWCPPTLAFDQATVASLDTDCRETGPSGTTFFLDGPNGPYPSQQIDGTPLAVVAWQDVPPGTYTVTEDLPDGANYRARVFCYEGPMAGNNGLQPDPQEQQVINGGSVQLVAEAGFRWYCAFFNVPAEMPAADLPAGISVLKSWCPADLAFAQLPTPQDLAGACRETGPSGTRLTLDGPNPPYDTVTLDGSPDASGGWRDLPPGTYTVTEELPEGASYRLEVYCRLFPLAPEGIQSEAQEWEVIDGDSIQWTSVPATLLTCVFFNVPEETSATQDDGYDFLDLSKFYCPIPPPPSVDATLTWYEDNCNPVPQWDFQLAWAGGESTETTNADGLASWSGLPTGTWTVSEPQLQPGDFPPAVWCRYTEWPDEAGVTGEWALFEAPGGVYSSGFGYDQMRMECRFYNVPKPVDPVAEDAGYNYLDLYKFYCQVPAAPDAEAELAWYEDNCDSVALWDFNLEWTGGESTETTDANGLAQWTGLPTGTWSATEFLPDFYETPVVWCRYTEWPDEAGVTGAWAKFEAPDGVYSNGFGYDQMRMECRIYNIAIEKIAVEYNYLDLYKFYCQIPAAPPANAELSWYEDNCDPVGQWDFHLEWVGGESTETTNVDGRASWSGLPTGTWTATEFVPEGHETPIVWCRYTEWPDGAGVTGEWASYQAPGGVYSNGFGYEQMRMECRYYNIYIDEDVNENSVTVYKWDCMPGTEYGQGLSYYQGEDQDEGPCETEHLDIPMVLNDANGPRVMLTQANGTEWDGVTLQNGTFQIAEQIPQGYGDPMVFCGPLDQGILGAVPAIGGTITLSLPPQPFTYQCNWYNIPINEEYQLEVYKFLCAPDVDPTLGLPDLGTACSPLEGVSFTATFGAMPPSARYTDGNGRILWTDVPMGDWTLRETMLPGWGPPRVYCGPPQTAEAPEVPVVDLTVSGRLSSATPHIICIWFNFELEHENGRITVYKYQCPPGMTSADFPTLQDACRTPFNGVNFTLQSGASGVSASTVGGTVDWLDLDQGTYTVSEQLLPGYGPPLVWCGYVRQDGVDIDPGEAELNSYPVTGAAIQLQLSDTPSRIVCYWYNFPAGPAEITINKWLCPPGYDMQVWGADPRADCDTLRNGVTFTLDQPEGADLTATTGDSGPGAVSFGGLDPGAYTLTETVPSDTAYVFVLDCTGTNIPKVHQYPLSWSNRLDVNVAADDAIVCNWYNVPYPDDGRVTVSKYQCWTRSFTSAVDCEIYEFGASFELVGVPSGTSYGTGTTNATGSYIWDGLDAGSYRIDELSMQPCKATSSKVDSSGNIRVDAGADTTVKVYNCASPPAAPGTTPVAKAPGKAPGKFPNTGIAPTRGDDHAPAAQSTPEGTPQAESLAEDFYTVSCLEEPPDVPAATPTAPGPDASEDTGIPAEFDLALAGAPDAASTPAATSSRVIIHSDDGLTPEASEGQTPEEECVRGALPEHVVIEAANVDTEVETLEIIDGIMQQPTGPTMVTWYKETGRLGESNNVVIAGHLNWWNVPEGVFYHLQGLQAGDRVEITGDDGRIYVYEVEWVRQESNLEPPALDVIGPTDEPTLTLITCGGEWNADIAEYDERTVARAVQVDVLAADEADEAASSPLLGYRR